MKVLVFVTAMAASLALLAGPAEAAKKRSKAGKQHRPAVAKVDPYLVVDYDGYILGRDPDPFIRLMIAREGKIRDQHAR